MVYTRLPSHRSMVDAYWDVEYDRMSFFDRPGTAAMRASRPR